jgi:hypothetical protein
MNLQAVPFTRALRQLLPSLTDPAEAEDLLFLESWERAPSHGAADARRVTQLRRANPALAAAIRAELASGSR